MRGFFILKRNKEFSFTLVLFADTRKPETLLTSMHWIKWTSSQNDSDLNIFDSNWSNPIFRNVLYNLNNTIHGTQALKPDEYLVQIIPQAAQYGAITAFILIFLIEKFLIKEETLGKIKLVLQWPLSMNVFGPSLFSFLIFTLLLPILLIVFAIFFLYKHIVKAITMIKFRDTYIENMSAIDSVWAIEDDNALSVINVISAVDNPKNRNILENLRSTVSSKLFGANSICPKMMYIRSFHLGYYFWSKNPNIEINDYVRPLEFDDDEDDFVTEDELQFYVSEISNTKLPYNNGACWEILVSNKPLEDTNTYPVLFRIHHSLGDGVALLKLLLNTIGCDKPRPREYSRCDKCETFFKALSYFMDLFTFKNSIEFFSHGIVYLINLIGMIVMIPQSLLNQVLRPPDENILHGPPLSGNKIVTWVCEDRRSNILRKIKNLKKRIPGTTFSELILTSLSASYNNYFSNNKIPDFITSVIPVRMDTSDLETIVYKKDRIELDNKFSVAMLTIPIKCTDNEEGQISILKRLVDVRRETSALRSCVDFYVNYGLMKITGYLLPKIILKPMMTSVQATLVVSNLPGPSDVYMCKKFKLQKMVFFVPHRGTTGMGVTVFSCNDKIFLGMMVDTALIDDHEDATNILEGVFHEIDALDKFTSKNDQFQENIS